MKHVSKIFPLAVALLFWAGFSQAQYCTTGLYIYGCQFGDDIDNLTINTLNQVATGCASGAVGYSDYTALTPTDLTQGNTYTFSVSTVFGGQYMSMWIDLNDDQFFDPSEKMVADLYCGIGGTMYSTPFLMSCSGTAGLHRMRVRTCYATFGFDACQQETYGEVEDYTVNVVAGTGTGMSYTSSTCTQNNLGAVQLNDQNVEMLGLQIVADGCGTPLDLTSLTLNSNGTTNFGGDVTNVEVWYTGTNPTFSTSGLFGSATDLTNPISGTQTLSVGTNYFWVTYDVSASATYNDFLDAECTSLTLSGTGGTQTPTVTAPPGSRLIQACIPSFIIPCSSGDYIDLCQLNTLSNVGSGCNGNVDNYISYAPTGTLTTTMTLGQSYTINLQSGPVYSQGFGVWIDFNNNGDFGDAGEFVYQSPYAATTLFTGTVTLPFDNSFVGDRRMRVRCSYFTIPQAGDFCTLFTYGETEDYTITLEPPPPCAGVPDPGVATADPTDHCVLGESSTLTLTGYTVASGLTIQWEDSPDGITFTPIAGATNSTYTTAGLNATTYYHAVVTCTNSGSSAASNTATVDVGAIAISSSTGDITCGLGVTDLTATANGDYIYWFDVPTGGYPIYTTAGGSSTYSPVLSSSQTFYVAAEAGTQNIGNVGAADNLIGPGSYQLTGNGLNFDVLAPCTLVSVTVYPQTAGTVTMYLYDQFFALLQTFNMSVTAADIGQPTPLILNYLLPVGTNYHLLQGFGSTAYLFNNDFGGTYPYTLSNVLNISGDYYGGTIYPFFYNWQIDYSELCESPRVAVLDSITPPPALSVASNPTTGVICSNTGGTVTLDATSGSYNNFSWAPAAGLSSTTGAIVDASPVVTTTYTVTADDGTCTNVATVVVTLSDPPTVTVTAAPDSICSGSTVQLNATAAPAGGYIVLPIPYAPVSGSGTVIPPGDDSNYGSFPIGFTFNFFGTSYTDFYIGTNGFIFFDPNSLFYSGCCAGQLLPTTFQPNGLIAGAWEDLNTFDGGTIEYFTTGIAPNRKLIVNYNNVPHYGSLGLDPVTMQIICYETTNIIEVHTTDMPGNPNGFWAAHTEGIEDASGTLAAWVPGRNADATWTVSPADLDAWQFVPTGYSYNWTPAGTLNDATIAAPIASPTVSTTYTITVTNSYTGCVGTGSVDVNVIPTPNAGSIATSATSVCGSGSVDLTLNGFTQGATIQWQQSATSGGPYTNIGGATNSTYTTPVLSSTTYYVAMVSCVNSSTTSEIEIEVLVPPADPVGIDGEHCGPGQVWLQANGVPMLSWFDASNNYVGSGSPFLTSAIASSQTYYVESVIGALPANPLTTTYIAGNGQNGNMFDVTINNPITITSFDGNISTGPVNMEIYYKAGTFVGNQNNAGAWTLVGSTTGMPVNGFGVPTPITIPVSLSLTPGTYAFYITTTDFNIVNYTNGTFVGNVAASDPNLTVYEGDGIAYPFGGFFEPRTWNGTIHYQANGCASNLVPVNATIYQPDFSVVATSIDACIGHVDSMGVVNNNGYGSWHTFWTPVLPQMIPPNGISDSVKVVIDNTTLFTIYVINDSLTCADTLTLTVTAHPDPVVSFSGLANLYYTNDGPATLTGVPAGGFFGGGGYVIGNQFLPSVAGAGGPYPVSYTYTDQYGCSNTEWHHTYVDFPVGINEITNGTGMGVFPNPSNGQFTVVVFNEKPVSSSNLHIYNSIGQMVYEENTGAWSGEFTRELDFKNWAAGNYYVEMNVDGAAYGKKLTIQY